MQKIYIENDGQPIDLSGINENFDLLSKLINCHQSVKVVDTIYCTTYGYSVNFNAINENFQLLFGQLGMKFHSDLSIFCTTYGYGVDNDKLNQLFNLFRFI